jgi:tetratricopeptide (TPR) repeat protein
LATVAGGAAAAWLFPAARRWLVLGISGLGVAVACRLIAGGGLAGGGLQAWQALGGRLWIWRCSATAALDALPLGAGLGGFAPAYLDAQARALAPMPVGEASRAFVLAQSAHGDWLQTAVESGLLAPLLLGLALISAVRAHARGQWAAGVAVTVAFAVMGFADAPLRQPGVLIPWILTLAGLPGRTYRLPRPLAAISLAAASLVLAAATAAWLGARTQALASATSGPARVQLLARASRLDPASGEIAVDHGLALLEAGHATAAITELERARLLVADVGTEIALGNAYQTAGQTEAAREAFRRAARKHPGSVRARVSLARAESLLGDFTSAGAELDVVARVWPRHPLLLEARDELARAELDRRFGP